MEKIRYFIFVIILLVPVSISTAYAQSLYVDARVGDMNEIDDSKYSATAVSIVRNADGELISVVRIDATRYLADPIVDEFLNSNPDMLIKTGVVDKQKVNLYRTIAEYNNPECLERLFDVSGYDNKCEWYHRAFVTMLGVNKDDTGEKFTIFRGLNHGFVVKPLYDVTTIWDIITKD